MSLYTVLIVLFLAKCFIIITALDTKKCYEECSANEVFVLCNASCQPVCSVSLNNTVNMNCGCVHGCVCKSGMIRSSKTGKCVTMKKCLQILSESNATKMCGDNEHYIDSRAGCQSSCYNMRDEDKLCPDAAGCVCDVGYVRDVIFGRCIPIHLCPKCHPNENWIPCSNCTTFKCRQSCGFCVCGEGHIPYENHCIRDCYHRKCSKNEEYLKCANCENCCFNNPRTTCDKRGCYEGCYCKKDFVRNPLLGICVPFENCPTHCKRNETFDCTTEALERNCQNLNEPSSLSSQPCTSSCHCKDGFVRQSTANNSCVHYTDC